MRGARRSAVAEALIPGPRLPAPVPALCYDLHPIPILSPSRLPSPFPGPPAQELDAGDG